MNKLTPEQYKIVADKVCNYKTDSEFGFNQFETKHLLRTEFNSKFKYKQVMEKIGVHTGMIDQDGYRITYPQDILLGIVYLLEEREQSIDEWD
mgnify:CR=1 FL=1